MYAIVQRHKRLAAIIIAVASISFLFWMFSIADIKQMFGLKRCVATVNGACIDPREFRYELLRYSQLLEREEFRSLVKRQVLYSLVSREALYQKAKSLGLIASDKEVADYIKNDSSFHENGKFSISKYKEALERIGLTPEEYETYLKKRLTIQKLLSLISKGVYITDKEEDFQKRIMSVRFRGKLYLISPESVKVDYKPTLKEMKDFYKRNKDKFVVPSFKKYRIWKTENKEKAHSIYSDLKKGKLPDGSEVIESVEKADIPKEVSEELEKLSNAVRYSITKVRGIYYVVYLDETVPERIKPFEEVKEEIRELIIEQKKLQQVEKEASAVKEKLSRGQKVNIKYLTFDNSKIDEFVTLFKIREDEVLKLIFSNEKVFGPYRTANGYAVIYIESRDIDRKKAGNIGELRDSLIKAKKDSLLNAYIEKLVQEADIKINEEYLK